MEWWELVSAFLDEETETTWLFEPRRETPELNLIDERCVRCQKPTRYSTPGADGLPTCRSCRDGLAHPQEKGRPCPVDGTALQPEQVSNVAVERCPACAGVWLDGGELELITKAVARAAKRGTQEAQDLLATVLAGLPRRPGAPGPGESR